MIALMVVAFTINQDPSISTTLETTKATITDNNGREIQTTTYINKDGKITLATDKGYATHRQAKEDGKAILEEYLDAEGKPVLLSSGYAAIERVYEDGLNTIIIYLDTTGAPVVNTSGFNTIHRTYTDQRLASVDTYWIGDQQVTRKQGYASLHRIYGTGADEKRIVRQEYRNISGDLVLNSSGYAYLTRSYNSLGKIETELYYNTAGESATLSLGQCGYTRLYDEEGRISSTTYLGADQTPINTKNGYATIKNTYTGSEAKHLYFDATEAPTTGTHGEYGYTTVSDGKKIYLNSSGEPLQRLDIFLNSNPVAVLILGAVFTILALFVPGKARVFFLLLYLVFIYLMTLAWREGIDAVKGELFWSYRQFLSNPGLRQQIIKNVFLFIPLGVILTRMIGGTSGKAWLAVLICLVLSAAIETIQMVGQFGTFEWDDMISNGLGGVIGSLIATILPNRESTTQAQEELKRI